MNHLVFYWVRRISLVIWNSLANIQRAILITTSTFIVIILFGSVLMRYVIHYPGMEIEEIVTLVAFWLYFTGAVYGSYERSHIKAELLHLVFKKPRAYALVKVTASLIVFILAVVMSYWGYHFFIWGIEKWGRSAVLLLPMVYAQSSIFVGAIFMSFYFLVELVDNIRQVLGISPVSKVRGEE